MSDGSGGKIVAEAEGKVVVADEDYNVVTQGDTKSEAQKMFDEARALNEGGGRQIGGVELMHDFGLSTESLNTKRLPADFSECSPPESYPSPRKIGSTLLHHGFRPISRTDNHLKIVSIRDPCEKSVIIPMSEEFLDPFVIGFIAENISDVADEPNDVIGWLEES